MSIPDKLVQAYEQTHYEIRDGNTRLTLLIGKPSRELHQLFSDARVTTAAYLTAWNPRGQIGSPLDNTTHQLELLEEILSGKWKYFIGQGRDPKEIWEPECSFLVLGIPREKATRIAMQFHQIAFVWIESDTIPRLKWTGVTPSSSPSRKGSNP